MVFKREGQAGRAGQDAARHAAGADRAGRGGHDAEHHLREGSAGHVSARREEEVLPAAPRRARTATARSHRDARSPTASSRRTTHERPVRHLLRRQPSALRRQRRQGDGLGEGRLSAGGRAVRERARALDPARQPERDARWRALVARLDDGAASRASRSRPADADDRRSDRQGAGGGAALPPRPVLPAAELRGARRGRRVGRRDAAADGRHRADRRVGRQGERAAVADRARAGRVEPARARTCARASRWW